MARDPGDDSPLPEPQKHRNFIAKTPQNHHEITVNYRDFFAFSPCISRWHAWCIYLGRSRKSSARMPQMTPYAKAAAYAGLALVTPISGWICYKIGQFLDQRSGTTWISLAGLLIGCASGMYETYRAALRIEGLDPDKDKPKRGTDNPE
ncbi:MAG: AtpZ/AtpI family protein [Bryobacteraceae bacterium]